MNFMETTRLRIGKWKALRRLKRIAAISDNKGYSLSAFGEEFCQYDAPEVGNFYYTERVVELPFFSKYLQSRINIAFVGNVFVSGIRPDVIVDKYDEQPGIEQRDLFDYDFGSFDTVVSISTLEHVGQDGGVYGDSVRNDTDPTAPLRAIEHIVRTMKIGAEFIFSVPYGRYCECVRPGADHPWLIQFSHDYIRSLKLPIELAAFVRTSTTTWVAVPANDERLLNVDFNDTHSNGLLIGRYFKN